MRLFRRFRKQNPPTSPPPPLQTVVINRAPNSPSTTSYTEPNNSTIKSTNFSQSVPISRSEIRHKSEIEVEVKQQQPLKNTFSNNISPVSTSSYPPVIRPIGITNNRTRQLFFDENSSSTHYQIPKHRIQTNSIQTQTPLLHQNDYHIQQLKTLNDETLLKNEKIHVLLRELTDCQRQTYEHIYKLEDQIKYYESDAGKMRDHVLCSKIKLDKKFEDNDYLSNELTNMKKFCDRLEQENQKLKLQIDFERKKNEECMKSKTLIDIELQSSLEKIRSQRYEYETKLTTLDESLKYSQKQYQNLQQNQHLIEGKHEKEIHQCKHHIHELEIKIEEVIKDKALISIRCGELIEENRKLEKALNDKEDDYEEKINCYKEKNTYLSTQIEDIEKKLSETKKQLEIITMEKDETLADMLIAVRVASELRYDAEDRLNKANDDLKRVTDHIEQERAINKAVQRKQIQLVVPNRNSNEHSDFGHVKIKEMIRTLEANSRNNPINILNTHNDSPIRQRPVSQPCTRTETNAILINHNHRQFDTSTDDAKILSSTKNISPLLNSSQRSDTSVRSITNEQYDEMKSIVEAVFARMPGSVCKRDALLKWCVEKLANYGISITNFSNSWTDGIAFCSLLHSYLPDRVDLEIIKKETKKKRFEIAFNIASSVGIVSVLDVDEMCSSEWPDWERVMYYVALIFRHFEGSASLEPISPILPIPQASSSPLSPTFSNTSSPSLCVSLRSSNTIPTKFCSPLQTV
ncbi:unnamed protein product [Adineta steineri]|uniref:Calponin-homology (CH) domain-containing protein n=1 Tax=Adineta steineri TaxID=433720 RepID=A0A814WS36_9BILA|nr:unnamed protein product [Adineta steineri]